MLNHYRKQKKNHDPYSSFLVKIKFLLTTNIDLTIIVFSMRSVPNEQGALATIISRTFTCPPGDGGSFFIFRLFEFILFFVD